LTGRRVALRKQALRASRRVRPQSVAHVGGQAIPRAAGHRFRRRIPSDRNNSVAVAIRCHGDTPRTITNYRKYELRGSQLPQHGVDLL